MSSGTTDMIYEYMNGALSKVKTYAENDNGTAYEEYNHTYDVFGNQLSVSVGNMPLSTNTYAPNNGKLTSSTYGNGASINYYYDNLDRIVSLRYNNNEQTAFNYTYNRFGSVSAITDTASGIAKIYDYDTVGRLISARTENGTNDVFRTHYTYDGLSRLDTLKYVYSTSAGTRYTHEYSATYGEDSRVNTFGLNGIFSITPTFDGLGRQSSRVLKNGSGAQVEKEAYTFTAGAGGANATTTLIDSVTYYGAGTTGTQYSYEYDKSGNLMAEAVSLRVAEHAERSRLIAENARLKRALNRISGPAEVIGSCWAMRAVFAMIEQVASSSATVLIRGGSGTGKELMESDAVRKAYLGG